jgi:H/ACA ribonucleoprotein complex subunit 4
VECEAGTYIRKLAHDMGLVLGTGAHMHELRRTKAGPFTEDSMVTLYDLRDAQQFYEEDGDETHLRKMIQPIEAAVSHLPKVWVRDTAVGAVCHGASLNMPGIAKLDDGIGVNQQVALMTLKDELIGVGRSTKTSKEMAESKRGEAVKPKRTVMAPDVYPRKWKTKS